jgi:hypothetical protein
MTNGKKAVVKKAAAVAGASASGASEAFTWDNTMPCVATYKVLEGDKFLDQFEDASVAFNDAGSITIGRLRFFPHVTDDSDILQLLADQMARKFLVLVEKTFTIKKHDPNESNSDVIDAIADVFVDPDKTLTDLAQAVSEQIDFPSNQPGGGQ